MNTRQLHELLYTLGIGSHYLGHNITAQAIQLICCNKDSLLRVKDGIYIPIATQFQCDWRAVERNIRTVVHRAWTLNRPLIEHMAFYPLDHEPTVTEFLGILSVYVGQVSR